MWGKQPDKLPGHYNQHNPQWLENCRIQKNNIHWHKNSVHLQPPHPTQIYHYTIPIRQANQHLKEYDYITEITTIQNILQINFFPNHDHKTPIPCPSPEASREQTPAKHTHVPTHKWATFTFIGKETTFIPNLFSKANIKIAFRNNNSIQNLLIHKQQTSDIYSRLGVISWHALLWKGLYGTNRLELRHTVPRTHKTFRKASRSSNFDKHLIDHTHSFGPIHNIMQILQLQNKGANLNSVEPFFMRS